LSLLLRLLFVSGPSCWPAGILERGFCLLGEYCLHVTAVFAVVTLLTFYSHIPLMSSSAAAVTSGVINSVSEKLAESTGLNSEL
jgi:hypothetical protein